MPAGQHYFVIRFGKDSVADILAIDARRSSPQDPFRFPSNARRSQLRQRPATMFLCGLDPITIKVPKPHGFKDCAHSE